MFERRNLGNPEEKSVTVGLNTVTKPIKPIRPVPAAAIGVFLTEVIGVEAQFQRSASDNWPYTYSYGSDITKRMAEHHDTVVLGNVRIRAKCWSAVCLEPVAGAGLALHHSSSVITLTCGSVGVPLPCTTPTKADSRDWNVTEPKVAFAFGADIRIAMNKRVSIAPSLRVDFIEHNSTLYGTDHRLPQSGDQWFLAFGASISVR